MACANLQTSAYALVVGVVVIRVVEKFLELGVEGGDDALEVVDTPVRQGVEGMHTSAGAPCVVAEVGAVEHEGMDVQVEGEWPMMPYR